MPDRNWALILHGGAKTIGPDSQPANREGCLAAAQVGRAILEQGGSAVEAVEAVIRVLEDDAIFNAGFGSVLNDEGEVEMCSSIMEGARLNVGGVAAIQGVRHPISVARAMLNENWTLIAGEGGRRFAEQQGLELCPPEAMIAREQQASEAAMAHDTVGAVALDMNGLLCAGTSTGGLAGQVKGRVGDSPLPGCGLYAENGIGAVAFSGEGERITRAMLAAKAMQALEQGSPAAAAAGAAIERLHRVGGEAGIILLDRHGRIGIAHNSDHFALAVVTSGMEEPRAGIHRRELEELIDHG